jgi:hypothetical protein
MPPPSPALRPFFVTWIILACVPLFVSMNLMTTREETHQYIPRSTAFDDRITIIRGDYSRAPPPRSLPKPPQVATENPAPPVVKKEPTADVTTYNNNNQEEEEKPKPHPHAGARSQTGQLGYIADPTALKRGREHFLNKLSPSHNNDDNDDNNEQEGLLFWQALEGYQKEYRLGTLYGKEILSSEYTCAFGPGQGMEQDSGYKLLVEKIRVYNDSTTTTAERGGAIQPPSSSPRILCAIYSYSGMRDLARTQALLWGYKCNGFLVFSNETIPSLGMVNLLHQGEESYNSMWQKTRSIWTYIHEHYLQDYDFFHLGGDDMYVMVENLRHFLTQVQASTPNDTPLHLGQWVSQPGGTYMVSGGPGYTLNAAAVKRLVQDALPVCHATREVHYEDKLLSQCLGALNVTGSDTRALRTGEQQYHGTTPAHLYMFRSRLGRRQSGYQARIAVYWEGLAHPSSSFSHHQNQTVVGPKHGLEAAATYSVSFHDLYTPQYVARIHALVYRNTCPAHSPLGRGLRKHVQMP